MATYDRATEEFISKFAEPSKEKDQPAAEAQKEPSEPSLSLKPLRTIRQVVKGVEDPKKAIGKLLVRAALNEAMDKQSTIKILSLYQFMNDHYGRDWWDWEPETIWKSLETDHLDGEGATPDELKNAVMALQLCVNTMAPWEHWHIFEKVGHAFNWNPVNFAIVQPLEPDEAALTMQILRKLQPKTAFEPEVLVYVAACAKSAGMVYLPDDMAPGVQERLDDITFEVTLREQTKKSWETGELPSEETAKNQVEIQLQRLQDIKDLLQKESLSA